jgi:hypothetical protein
MRSIAEQLKIDSPPKLPNSQRSYWIQQIADLTGMKFMVIFGKVNHLVGEKGTEVIKTLYLDALTADTQEGKRKRLWWLLAKTKS